MPTIPLAGGGRVHVEVLDVLEPWLDRETIFLHHGLGKSSRFWRPWMRLLAEDYRVVAIDMLGNGRSSRPRHRRWSIEGYAENVVEVLDALDIERAHFVGETVGGCVGLVLGARHADRLDSLALASCPIRPPRERLLARSRVIAREGLVGEVDAELPSRLEWHRYPPAMYHWYRAERLSASPRIVAEQTAAQAVEELEWTLPRIGVPTLLFIPDESPVDANVQMLEMARVIPDARVAELPPGRKPVWYHYGEAAVCVAEYRRFLGGLGARPAGQGPAGQGLAGQGAAGQGPSGYGPAA